ncbi:hypothetical protein SADUNF_Sadunf16G0287100 [Salix dunnii]|uniref:Uncharacterized protein n=1 Tax=Salix dunnii TaxID=1413687 RepID=A0A835MHT4_9ROSI|nr:hypothetical protein SADUNF_Sadunf16G0287100 [Salix dunnii]
MGNCLRHESQDFSGLDMKEKAMNNIEEEGLLEDNSTADFTSCSPTTTAASTTKVKIKISKKQLEELIGRDLEDPFMCSSRAWFCYVEKDGAVAGFCLKHRPLSVACWLVFEAQAFKLLKDRWGFYVERLKLNLGVTLNSEKIDGDLIRNVNMLSYWSKSRLVGA